MNYLKSFDKYQKTLEGLIPVLEIYLKIRINNNFYDGPFLFGNYKNQTLMANQQYAQNTFLKSIIKFSLNSFYYKNMGTQNKILFCVNKNIYHIVGSYQIKDNIIWSSIPNKKTIARLAKQDGAKACFKMANFLKTDLRKASDIIKIAKDEK